MEDQKTPEAAETENPQNKAEASEDTPKETKEPAESRESKKKKKDDGQAMQKLQKENEELIQELAETKDLYKRMLAEYANYKRRTDQEKEQLGVYIKAETLKALLPALDNLERAVEAPPGEEYKTGIDMTIRQLAELLAAQGLETIEAKGAAFDPEVHHAVMREDAEGVEPDTVTEVFQKGYKVGDRVLRPAMVKVAN